MRLLDRYLLRELLPPLAYCLGGFLIFWISFDLFSELDRFQQREMGLMDIGAYYLITAPGMLIVVVPVALLLALLYVLTNHARHNELTAIRAAGVGLWRIATPYIAVGILSSLALFAVNELWVPQSQEHAEDILDRNVATATELDERDWQRNLFLRNEQQGRSWRIPAYNRRTHELLDPEVIWQAADGGRREIYAQRAAYVNNAWTFYDVEEVVYSSAADPVPHRSRRDVLRLPELSETPELIRSEIKVNNLSVRAAAKRAELSLEEIYHYLQLHPDLAPSQRAVLGTQWHGRIAAPWTCLTVVLIALPFGAMSGRRNVFVGVAGSIVLAFSYFILQRLGLALGTGGYIAPWLAAWLPNLFFALLGIGLTLKVR